MDDPRLVRMYDNAVRDSSVDVPVDLSTNEERAFNKRKCSITLPCGQSIDLESLLDITRNGGDKFLRIRKVHPGHFVSNKAISKELCIARCHFLKLSNVEQFLDIAENELKEDRRKCKEFCQRVINNIVSIESNYRSLLWGSGLKVKITQHLGKALADVTTVEDAKPIWTIAYRTFQHVKQADLCKRVADVLLLEIGVCYDTSALQQNMGNYTCFQSCMSTQINVVHKQLQTFAKRGGNNITIGLSGPYNLLTNEKPVRKKKSKVARRKKSLVVASSSSSDEESLVPAKVTIL